MKVSRIVKAIVAGVAGLAQLANAAVNDGTITQHEWFVIGIAAAATVGVFFAPNAPKPAPASH